MEKAPCSIPQRPLLAKAVIEQRIIRMRWPFASRGARAATVAAAPQGAALNYAAYVVNDVSVTLWLPQRLLDALDTVSAETDTSRPDVIRGLLFEHLHGRAELARLHTWARTRPPAPEPEFKFTEKRYPIDRDVNVRMLGKSAADLKLELPSVLKTQMAAHAKGEGLGLSDGIRKVLVLRLLGAGFHARWQVAVGLVPGHYKEMEGRNLEQQ